MGVGGAFLYVSLLTARMVPADRRLVKNYTFVDVCGCLYSLRVSLHMNLNRLCFVSVRYIIICFVELLMICCKSKIVACMPLVLSVTAVIAGRLCSSLLTF